MVRYENAGKFLPPELLQQVQEFASGMLLYIPAKTDVKPKRELSGYQQWLKKRNCIMINGFRYGESIQQLAEDHHLSEDTVKKIIYNKKNSGKLVFHADLQSAQEYAEAGLLEEWAYTLMSFERCHRKFADRLYSREQHYFGPVMLPVNMVHRNTGPEKEMRFRISAEVFERDVLHWLAKIDKGEPLPPLLVVYEGGQFMVNCYNSMLEALNRRNTEYFYFVIRTEHDGLPALREDFPEICRV